MVGAEVADKATDWRHEVETDSMRGSVDALSGETCRR
jgi:hypothetical protein